MPLPTPHFEKLTAALANGKLPASDKPRLQKAIKKYHEWIANMKEVTENPNDTIEKMVELLNGYKFYIDMDLVFDSAENFLYRQKGQLKLDNSIIEEFLPWLIYSSLKSELADDIKIGPMKCFLSINFNSRLDSAIHGGGLQLRSKDQDFALCRKLFIKTSHNADFSNCAEQETGIAYVVAEIKTNLDKTMFQEASATAHDAKSVVSGCRYYLLCEWLDMTPLITVATDINEILILRGAKRLTSDMRANFSTSDGRRKRRDEFIEYLTNNPFRIDVFQRFVDHLRQLSSIEDPREDDVLSQGYF